MEKVSIVTFHRAKNYGAVLQTYALQETLKKYADEVKVLDINPKFIQEQYKLINTYSIKSIIASVINYRYNLNKNRGFENFRSHLLNLKAIEIDKEGRYIEEASDCIFFGSDQVWNINITKEDYKSFLGYIKTKETCKKISYAASIGDNKISKEVRSELVKGLNNFSAISVRENEVRELIGTSNRNIEVVLDPTLLLEKEEWEKIIDNYDCTEYMLLYLLGDSELALNSARQLADRHKLKVIQIVTNRHMVKDKRIDITLNQITPQQFVGLFKNANFIITNSFHGTAFSIIFEKQFYTIPHETRGARMIELARKLNLEDRLLTKTTELYNGDINYRKVTPLLEEERKNSIKFIELAINNGDKING